ncbi:rod shape-determining protein MreD [uncultured Eubacterium sp.]|uniref:rod shape-determining protein MreD n=1 Tax=uncultured Eubacterium sp. TaxID=165185 RepID=UPI002673A403|nr:rod shape-determining protein MreD [uncultured Eubacterium sp.]
MKHRLIKIIITAVIIITAFVLQTSLSRANYQTVATPNLLLMTTCIFGFMRGCNYGSVTGLICGLLVDIFFGDVIGLYALIYMYVGFFSGLFKKMFYSNHIFMPMLLVLASDFTYNLACYTFRFLLRNKLDFSFYFNKVIIPEMIITTFVTFLLYKLFYLLNEKIFTLKQENILSFDK